jgi:hypothetical protein
MALAVCFVVELSQLYHAPALDALRQTTVGHLVLGSDFDPRDLAAYAAGVLAAAMLERSVVFRYLGKHDRPGMSIEWTTALKDSMAPVIPIRRRSEFHGSRSRPDCVRTTPAKQSCG